VTVGIDLGGTGTRVVALEDTGAVVGSRSVPTPRDAASGVDQIVHEVQAAAAGAHISAIGIGASGPIDTGGVIHNDDTLPAFSHIPVARLIGDRFGVPYVIDNDAVTAAIGENTYGAGEHSTRLLMITLGTGIGVALLIGPDTPYRGADGTHPEGGHIAVRGPAAPCYCGLGTCWEQSASRTALDELTGHATAQLAAKARARDQRARDVFTAYGERVGAGAGTLLTVLRPDRVVIGGSASRYLDLFAPGLDRALTRTGPFSWQPSYAAARLGDVSGAVGAAVLARSAARQPASP
jgi:glucokinase